MHHFAEGVPLPDHEEVPLDRLTARRRRPDRRLLLTEARTSRRAPIALFSEADIVRLLRASELDIDMAAAQLLAQTMRGGRIETIARLVAAGRLALYEEPYEETLFSGTIPKEAPPPEPPPPPPPVEEDGWIEIRLVDEDDRPIGGQDYRVVTPDGNPHTGKLDGGGKARIEGIPQGTCWVSFPSLGLSATSSTN